MTTEREWDRAATDAGYMTKADYVEKYKEPEMTTLIERLRQYAFDIKLHAPYDAKTLIEAADIIDRLTRERDVAIRAFEAIASVPAHRPKSGHLYECAWCNGSAARARAAIEALTKEQE